MANAVLTDNNIPKAVYADGKVSVTFPSGVELSFPIVGNWRLENATIGQLNNMEVYEDGVRWVDLDEDLSFNGILHGNWGQFVRRP